jgi:queuine/archaeosine tRNA-ribosyltransferase
MMNGRQYTLAKMLEENVINKNKPHHLLGCGLPQEFHHYKGYNWIDSLDTSNPVMHGIKNIRYLDYGLDNKESLKMFTIMDDNVLASWDDIAYNIEKFKEFCRV